MLGTIFQVSVGITYYTAWLITQRLIDSAL